MRKIGLVLAVIIFIFAVFLSKQDFIGNVAPKSEYTILLDAGHGGRDGGCSGDNSIEKELNLEYCKTLKYMLEDYGVRIVMTRTKDAALYSPFSKNKKLDDMRKRVSIINKTKPDLFISIHMNSTPYTYRKGAGVYYAKGNENGKAFADVLVQTYTKQLENAEPTAKIGDYYILQEPQYTGVLVECGFLSNKEEEILLLSKEYKQKMAYATFCAILLYLGIRNG